MPRLLIATNAIPRHSERRPRLYGAITLFAKHVLSLAKGNLGRGRLPGSQSSYRQMLTPSTRPSFRPARLSMTVVTPAAPLVED